MTNQITLLRDDGTTVRLTRDREHATGVHVHDSRDGRWLGRCQIDTRTFTAWSVNASSARTDRWAKLDGTSPPFRYRMRKYDYRFGGHTFRYTPGTPEDDVKAFFRPILDAAEKRNQRRFALKDRAELVVGALIGLPLLVGGVVFAAIKVGEKVDEDPEGVVDFIESATADYRITVDYTGYDQSDWAGVWRAIEARARDECVPGDVEDILVKFENVAAGALTTDQRQWTLDCDDL